ncbi:ESX secretion-associated protein EspG [Mycobacterium asiaticum]|nr:ESX secretion-associated protein EspG [Mycobacterium asiaticum]
MKRAALSRVGRIDLVDLQAISESLGRDFLPHPFVVPEPSRFDSYQEYEAYVAAVPERLAHGDLREFNQWLTSYVNSDIRVECVVSIVGAPRGRLLAHRHGQTGFLAAQNSAEQCIEVYRVSPYELGSAITGSLALTKPGTHSRIAIPDLVRVSPRDGGHDAVSTVLQRDSGRRNISIPRSELSRYTRVQSRCQPARDWGFDRRKNTAACVTIKNDGDYIYAPNFEYLTPMTPQLLSERIDALIAEDVASLRSLRGR